MKVLGIEGTAHTFGVGIVEETREDGRDPKILASALDMFRPESGGIHPREAANHHADVAGAILEKALATAGLAARDIDLVAFSQGPGLGPCLRTAATAARAFAIAAGKPLVGVNHCVAHLEIGRAVTPADDPVLLYASGGNTQIIAYTEGRYRVFGETLDVGVGNMLDKFAREEGIPFPGGPEIEKIAKGGSKLLELPYSIRGMDMAFSGILTAARAHLAKGESMADVCFSIQETTFAMLTEVTERALAHTEKHEVVLGGGVACNERLFQMTREMAEARGAKAYRPAKGLLIDNGAMIAHQGYMQRAHAAKDLSETIVDQRQRTDDIAVSWRGPERRVFLGAVDGAYHGAEAVVAATRLIERAAITKRRSPKPYRHALLDRSLRAARTRAEARALVGARRAGVRTPLVYDLHEAESLLVLERLEGEQLKETLHREPARAEGLLRALGEACARLHASHLVHGDLTTSNVLVQPDGALALIDFGLASPTDEDEAKGVDLHVLMEGLTATHADIPDAFARVLDGYRAGGGTRAVEEKVEEIARRGRYRGT
ncbi:MAG TPA: bifunctional N(6)-L-threonylcarbamoyladenine synthase/serine/threonine protein kinase [Candidatus Thermoplasmatota archaeon]|nr:bifunctional N(6)-L-threonylcarbamoyladenine synthase/serine/threonine protein kinase [Candidatus Thermoplasmatota archaeon]